MTVVGPTLADCDPREGQHYAAGLWAALWWSKEARFTCSGRLQCAADEEITVCFW
jgi:hypothetical protein